MRGLSKAELKKRVDEDGGLRRRKIKRNRGGKNFVENRGMIERALIEVIFCDSSCSRNR